MERKGLASSVFWTAKKWEWPVRRLGYRYRRAMLVARARAAAVWNRAALEIDIAEDIRLGKGVSVRIWPNTQNVLRIGPGALIGDRVFFDLNGGSVELADRVEIRRDSVFSVWGGRVTFAGENIFTWGVVIHCAEAITIGRLSSAGEYTSFADSQHFFTEPDAFAGHNTRTKPVVVGYNCWIGAKATIASGVTIGDHCIVGANSVVTRDVPDGHLVAGVPAQVVRELDLPWKQTAPELARAAERRARRGGSSA